MHLPEARLYIKGELRRAAGDKTYDTINPWTGEPVGKAADASPEDVNEAVLAARQAFDGTDWSTNKQLRFDLVSKLYHLLVANRERLGSLARFEAGAAVGAIPRAQVDMALDCYASLLELFPAVRWESERGDAGPAQYRSRRKVVYEAIGVVGAITPWNVPLYVNVGKVVSALLAGCTVILKPAPNTPGVGALFGELAAEARFPPGVFNVVIGADPALAGEMLVTDPRVDLISFTGSTQVGRRIMEKAAPTLKRLFLELGGKSAKIVLDDVTNFAQEIASSMLVFHAGQGCAVQSRLLVSRKRYAEAIAPETMAGGYGARIRGEGPTLRVGRQAARTAAGRPSYRRQAGREDCGRPEKNQLHAHEYHVCWRERAVRCSRSTFGLL
jgi:aldehyde dehydrogenase (NAD+)